MTKAAFINQAGALYPMDDDGREMLHAMPENKAVMVDTHAARNPRHHRLLFVLLRHVMDGGAWEGDQDSLLEYLKIATHLVRTVIGADGKVYYVVRSIAFESMPQDKFAAWFDRAVYVICTKLLGSEDWETLRDEIAEAVDGDLGRRAREAA